MDSDLVQGAWQALPYTVAAVLAYHVYSLRRGHYGRQPLVIPSPSRSVARVPLKQQNTLPYPPDALPGARDIDSPYGSIRAYEWGPIDGPKTLLIHGISTPCVSLANVAKHLADAGHRVMLFDLFGRGYSATPDPATNPQTVQLFTSQIHIVLSSSELAWKKFHLVGYSLGGGISLAFTSYYPNLVESLTLIAPSGLIREPRMGASSRVLKSGILPTSVSAFLTRRRLLSGMFKKGDPENSSAEPALKPDSNAPLFEGKPYISVADAVRWQVRHNAGFVGSFMSSIVYAPITEQHERWKIVARRFEEERSAGRRGRALMLVGKGDQVIVGEELVPDAVALMGEDGLQVEWIDAGHDLPIVRAPEVAKLIHGFCAAK